MSSDVLITLRDIHKSFSMLDKPHRKLLSLFMPSLYPGAEFHALRGVGFDIHRGESVAIIGKNGSGKSTLLQIIAGILQPSAGSLQISARIAALLELGSGFNPEFTGRENIMLNASLLGLEQRQIADRLDSIIAFAEIGSHIDQQVKTYSSGMFMRLAFAVAVHTDPEVLIVDEALSVGDIYFQRKCFKRIEEMRQRGCALLFVTHSVDSVLQLCERAIVLERGEMVFDGAAKEAVKEYLKRTFGMNVGHEPTEGEAFAQHASEVEERDELAMFMAGGSADRLHATPGYNRDETRLGDGTATTCDCLVSSSHGFGPLIAGREPFRVLVRYYVPCAMDRLIFGVRVSEVTGSVVYSSNTLVSNGVLYACDKGTIVFAQFDMRCSLLRGQYFLTVGVSRLGEGKEIHAIDRRTDAVILGVTGDLSHADGIADLEASITMTSPEGSIREVA